MSIKSAEGQGKATYYSFFSRPTEDGEMVEFIGLTKKQYRRLQRSMSTYPNDGYGESTEFKRQVVAIVHPDEAGDMFELLMRELGWEQDDSPYVSFVRVKSSAEQASTTSVDR